MAGSLAHLDNRLLRTLPLLLFRPGKLSREWAQGRHAAYVSPLAVFLFSLFLLFTAMSLTDSQFGSPDMMDSSARVAGTLGGREVDVATERERYWAKIQDTAKGLAPLGLPLVVAALALVLAFKRGFNLYDHSVVALYLLAVFALAVTGMVAVPEAKPLRRVLLVLLFVHTVFHLRGAYGLSWVGAGVRTIALSVLLLGAFIAFMVVVTVVGVMS